MHIILIGYYLLADGFGSFASFFEKRYKKLRPKITFIAGSRHTFESLLQTLQETRFGIVLLWNNFYLDKSFLDRVSKQTRMPILAFNWDPVYNPSSLPCWSKKRKTIANASQAVSRYITVNPLEAQELGAIYCPPGFNPDISKPLKDKSYRHDVSLVCTNLYTDTVWDLQRIPRKKLVDALIASGVDFALYGPSNLVETFPQYKPFYHGFVPYEQCSRVFTNSKINLCTHAVSIDGYFSERLPQIAACGGVIATDVRVGFGFVAGEDYILLDKNDFVEQILGALNDNASLRRMSSRALSKSSNLTWKRLCDEIVDFSRNF
jgi:hypothetical protein